MKITVLFDPPFTVDATELEPLADELRGMDSRNRVEVRPFAQRGPAVEPEVLQLFLDTAANAADVALFVAAAVGWMKSRLRKKGQGKHGKGHEERLQQEESRQHYVMLFGPNGEVLKSVLVPGPDQEPKDITPEDPRWEHLDQES